MILQGGFTILVGKVSGVRGVVLIPSSIAISYCYIILVSKVRFVSGFCLEIGSLCIIERDFL